MNRKFYYDTVKRMQRENVDPDYIQGWIGGFMGNPKREEQRLTPEYEAGYADGEQQNMDGAEPSQTGS